ncbi:LamG-like jellyroll fold domain-containing protein [Actinoplanes friuliensis]|uniref:Laminin G sub domain 2 n=1 Tax=Actinoplanes friuliensis DSM 7358 TaxID=1246995 RepID=U5W1K9_9ACTN|nr:LamG-like jellyroll fold domain-containing protein [Actinoplanes friuliensis]AGZ43034.1 laminin G sub domain 2 [Actinoplanes friuliensis DSM 7358]
MTAVRFRVRRPQPRAVVLVRRALLLLVVAAAVGVGGASAWAYWTAGAAPGGAGSGIAASVNLATTPTVSKYAAQAVQVTWPAVTLSNTVAVDGYVVTRYNSVTLATQTVLSGCAGTITTLTCTETGVPTGSWRYSVHPVIGTNWAGAESGLSTTVSTAPATLTLAQTLFKGPFPIATTGTIAGFGVNEALSYRLDAATPLTGFPTVVDVTGSAPISSLSIPSAAEGPHTVTVTGAHGSTATTTITIDTVAPIPSAVLSPAGNGTGWSTTPPVQVSLSAIDGTSGVAAIRYTLDGTDPTVSGTAITYSGPFPISVATTVRYFATDLAGNASTVATQIVKFDAVAPANSITLTGATGAKLTGTTIFYRGSTPGSFTLTNAVSDALSGPASSSTVLGGTSTGFTHVASTVSTPAGGPYVSNTVSWAASTSSAPTATVTGADVAGNTTATVLGLVNDSTAPAGGSVDATGLVGTGSRYSTSTSLSVAFAKGTDTGVGLATGTLLQRATATLSNGVCGTYGTATTLATDPPSSPYADTVADQACYRYQYVVADGVGNTTTYLGGDVKVDTTAPSASTFASTASTNTFVTGSTLYYRSNATSGSITLTATATDPASGILSYAFPAFGTNWTSTPGTTGINTYAWSGAPAAPGTKSITATNNAGLTTGANLTAVSDTTAPTGSAPTYTAGFLSSPSVSVTIPAGADTGGSGISTALGVLQRRSAPMTAGVCGTYGSFATIVTGPPTPYADTTVANGTCNQYQYVYSDNVGNTTPYASSTVVKAPKYYTCQAAITADNPDEYYQMAEAAGPTAIDSSGKTRNGSYTGTITPGTVGACGSGATLPGGSAGYIATPTLFDNPTVYSQEVWFRTATAGSTTTGKLIGFGKEKTGGSGNYDRHVYLSSNGKVNFGAWNILLVIPLNISISSPLSYNDGKWHHVAATQSGSGMKLYVDGALVASNGVTAAQNYTGYWRVGWDNLNGWGSQSNTDYFNGAMSNAAFYSAAELSATQIYDHYLAGAVSTSTQIVAPAMVASIASAPSVRTQAQPPSSSTRAPSVTASPSRSVSVPPSVSPSVPLSVSVPPSVPPSVSVPPSPPLSPSPSVPAGLGTTPAPIPEPVTTPAEAGAARSTPEPAAGSVPMSGSEPEPPPASPPEVTAPG